MYTVQLELLTVQQDSRQPVDSSARVNHFTYGSARACDSSATFEATSTQFSKKLFTQSTVQLHLSQQVYQSTRVKYPYTQFS